MDKALKALRSVLYGASVLAMSAMLIIIFMQVVSRYCFGYTPEWSEEASRFLFVWVVFLGSALIMGESGHLAVKLLATKLEGTVAGIVLEIFVNLCSYAFILLLIIQGSKMTSTMTFQTSPGLGISMSWVYCVLPFSGALMLLYLIKDSIKIIKTIAARRGQET